MVGSKGVDAVARLNRQAWRALVVASLGLHGCARVTSVQVPVVPQTSRHVVARAVEPVPSITSRAVQVQPPASGLFAEPFDASRVAIPAEVDQLTTQSFKDDYAKAQFGNAFLNPQPTPWGLIGVGTLGGGLLAYGLYAGFIGARDLMTPKKNEDLRRTPDAEGWAYEPVSFKGYDGINLVGWYIPATSSTNRALLMLHGHTSNKDRMMVRYAKWLRDYNMFFYDSRYHGDSEGKLTTLGWRERRDAAIALDLVKARGNQSIGVMGVSMGAAVAIGLAADRPEIKSVWSDCSFDSLHGAVAPRAKLRNYVAPDYVAWSVVKVASARTGHDLSKADPIRSVEQLAPRPLYLVHGLKDNETTPINSRRLFDKAGQPKTLWEVPEAAHAESSLVDPVGYEQRLKTFFASTL